MSTNVQLSFDFVNYQQCQQVTANHFLESYSFLFESYIEQAQIAFDVVKETIKSIPPIEVEPRLHAVMLNGMIVGRMMRLYPEQCMRREYNRASFIINSQQLFIKKFDENLLPSNAISKHNTALRKQLVEKHKDKISILWLGYTVDEYWKAITGFYACSILEDEVQWSIDIEEYLRGLRSTSGIPNIPTLPIVINEPELKSVGKEKKKIM